MKKEERFERICPSCRKTIMYKTKQSLYICNYNNTICRSCHNNKKLKSDCNILLNNSLESYYWLGFLMADGHFNTKTFSISLLINKKDREHLLKLKKFLKVENLVYSKNLVGISFGGKESFTKLVNKYSINSNKTIFPPNISCIKEDNLKAFKIGFIDGDGCITYQTNRNKPRIAIKCHRNWQKNLEFMFNRDIKINKNGYCELCIGKQIEIFDYKNFILTNNIPFLERKWNKIKIQTNGNIRRIKKGNH